MAEADRFTSFCVSLCLLNAEKVLYESRFTFPFTWLVGKRLEGMWKLYFATEKKIKKTPALVIVKKILPYAAGGVSQR